MISKLLILLAFFPFIASANCDFAKDIKKLPNGNFSYSIECHLEAGQAFQTVELQKKRIVKLEKTIRLKDLTIQKQEMRLEQWRDLSIKQTERINTINKLSKYEKYIWGAGGAILTFFSVREGRRLAR